ncbi:POK19 protein, partial [Baryphthengus martii]|nr:POK19 protein [Baryphthengus martii]
LQKLLGTINWVRTLLGIPNRLFDLLKGDSSLLSPRRLTPAARAAWKQVEIAISSKQAYRLVEGVAVNVYVVICHGHPAALVAQRHETWKDPLHFL